MKVLHKSHFAYALSCWGARVQEFNGETDHARLLFSLPPRVSPSAIANSLNSMRSRLLRKSSSRLSAACRVNVLCGRRYFVTSCGGAPAEFIKQYIRQQDRPAREDLSRRQSPATERDSFACALLRRGTHSVAAPCLALGGSLPSIRGAT